MRKIPAQTKLRVKELIPDAVVENETVKKVKQPNPARKIEFEVGDALQPDFYPQFKTKHFDNECNFSARLVTKDGAVTEHDGKLAYDDGEVIARFYEKDTGDEDGGFEFDVVLDKKPKSNVLTWTITHKELDFFYQPALTEDEIAEGVSRPENVEGSYAVYHKTKKNNKAGDKEYRTGKAFHIYRPYAEDANGTKTWCDLHIDEQAGTMTVTVPEVFLAVAQYPVVIDPTFGYTSIGASTSNSSLIYGSYADTTEASSVTQISAYKKKSSSNANVGAGVYTDSSTSASTKVAVDTGDVSITSTTPAWYNWTVTTSLSASTRYWLLVFSDVSSAYYYDAGSTSQHQAYSGTFETWPTTMGSATFTASRIDSIYATYTASSGSPYTLVVDNASLTTTGQAVALKVDRSVAVDNASLSLAGQSVSFVYNRNLVIDSASLTLAGQTVGLTVTRSIAIEPATLTLTPIALDVTYTPASSGCKLLQETGDILLQETGDAILTEQCEAGTAYTLAVDEAVLSVTGQAVGLSVTRTLLVEVATLSVTGQDITFGRTYALAIEPGTLTLTGQDVSLSYSGNPGNIKYFDGSAWQIKQLKRYNGSSWESATLKRYNGSAWTTITY